MKIGIDARAAIWYRGTGIGTYTYQIIKNLSRIDKTNNYRLFWPGNASKDFLEASENFDFDVVGETKDKFWEEIHIPARLAGDRVDVYHVPQNGIGLPGKKTCPQVVTVHDLIPYIYPETVGRGYQRIFLQEMPRIVEQADRIITVSEHSRRDLKRYFNLPDWKIDVIYEAADDIYRPLDKEACRTSVHQRYGVKERFILYVGGFSPRKNVPGLIRAYQKVIEDLSDVILVIAGKPVRAFEELVSLVETLGLKDRVVFTGFVPTEDLPVIYNAASLFVYPSFYEGFGLPPLEAMACGTPVITSNVSSLPEAVDDAALAVDPHDVDALAAAMFDALSDPGLAADLIRRGLEKSNAFTWTKAAEQTLASYRAAAAGA